jgi:hypothetical protein
MIVGMPSRTRPQRRYDHRLRDLVRRTGDVTVATDLGVPRSTARGWLAEPATVIVSLNGPNLTELELRREVLRLRRCVQKLAALLRLMLAAQRAVGFSLANQRLPDERAKQRILRAVNQARTCMPLRALLRPPSVITESISYVATARHLCARRPVLLSAHIAASTDRGRSPSHRGARDLARVPTRPDGHAGGVGPTTGARVGLGVNLVPPRATVWVAASPTPGPSGEAEGRRACHTLR